MLKGFGGLSVLVPPFWEHRTQIGFRIQVGLNYFRNPALPPIMLSQAFWLHLGSKGLREISMCIQNSRQECSNLPEAGCTRAHAATYIHGAMYATFLRAYGLGFRELHSD